MNLARHAAVIWRFRGVAAVGLSLGIVLAVLASYSVSFSGGPSFTPRGTEVWNAVSSILVTQPGFPEGRVTLPQKQTDAAVTASGKPAVPRNAPPQDQVEFADPGRLANLADLYSRFLTSAEVLQSVPGHPKADQIQASPFSASANGQVLPIIQLSTNSDSRAGAGRLNLAIYDALRDVLAERQAANKIATGKRIEVKLIDPPRVALAAGRSRTVAILALVLCMLGTLAVIHILEGLRDKGAPEQDELDNVLPWSSSVSPPAFDDARPEAVSRPEHLGAARSERQAAAGRRPPT